MLTAINYQDQKTLIKLARQSIEYGLNHPQDRLLIAVEKYSAPLQEHKACFVTLEKFKQLRGCIGALIARQPLVLEVIESAFAAAFLDKRFPKVTPNELADLKIFISILTKPEQIKFTSEEDLITKLRPNIDGLILKSGNATGTFLPSVWEQLPEPKEFLNNLKIKAGLATDYWSNKIQIARYETMVITDE